MLKLLCLIKAVFLFTSILIAGNNNYAKTYNIKGESYPGHVELQWENNRNFDYTIYKKEGSKFKKCGETSNDYFFDFTSLKAKDVTYRIVPKGLSVNQASEFEVKVNGAANATDETYLDMVQKYT